MGYQNHWRERGDRALFGPVGKVSRKCETVVLSRATANKVGK
jgi:hypothetical protein